MPTRPAARRREEAVREYDVFLATCPARQLLDRLSDKWVTLVATALAHRSQRHSDLSRRIAGVSPLVASIKGWAESHMPAVAAARGQYDEVRASA